MSSSNKRNTKEAYRVWNLHNPHDKKIAGDGFDIHHKDENPANNALDNLQKLTHEAHTSLHRTGWKHREISKRKTSAALKGIKRSAETRLKMSVAQKGKPGWNKGLHWDEETKRKISESQKGKIITEEAKRKMSLAALGRVPWNKGKTGLVVQSENTKIKMKLAQQKRRLKERMNREELL